MATASGANFGYRRTIPHLLGIGLGYPAMVCAVGLGLGGVFDAVPEIHTVLKYAGNMQWSYEEDAYNPANFGVMIKGWMDAKKACEAKKAAES